MLNSLNKKVVLVIIYCCISGSVTAETCYTIYDIASKEKTYLHSFYDYLFGSPEDSDDITSHANYSGISYNLKTQSFHPVDLRNICITQYEALNSGQHGQIFLGKVLDENSKHTAENPTVFKFTHLIASNHLNPVSSNYVAMDYRTLEREVRIQQKIGTHPNILVFHNAYYFQPSSENSEMVVMAFSMDKLEKSLGERALEVYRSTGLTFHGLNEFYGWLTGDQITAKQAAKYIAQTLSAVVHLLNKGLLNIDLNATNIMLDKSDNIKLIDFSWVNEYDLSSSEEIEHLHKDFQDNIPNFLAHCFSLLMFATTTTSDDSDFFRDIFNSLSVLKDDDVSIEKRDEILQTTIESLETFQHTNKGRAINPDS